MFTYQFNYFFNNTIVEAKPENIATLMGYFDNLFLPSFFEEPSPMGPKKVIRMNGISDYDGVLVIFGTEILSIQINSNEDDIKDKDFIIDKLRYISSCLSKITGIGKSHRIAAIITSAIKMKSDVSDRVYRKFFNEEPNANIFEWNGRKVERININGSLYNLVKSVNRMMLINADGVNFKPFDGVLIEFDVNTQHENNSPRFDITDVQALSDLHDIARGEFNSFVSVV